jgi:hypothetical protein
MTQDQYGQARGAGYGARGDVVEDENDEYADDPGKPMTRFQKVASALRGDRPDPDEIDDDQVAANQAGTASPAATSPDVVTDADEVTDPDLVTDPDVVRDPDLVTDQDVAYPDAMPADRTGRHAGVPAQEMRPGDATDTLDDLGDLAFGNLLPDAADFTAQWQQIQFRFVDDPQASVTEAAEVVSQVTAKMEAAIQERQRAIAERQQAIAERQRSLHDRWGGGSEADTETLRETLRMYRAFLDQLIGSKA